MNAPIISTLIELGVVGTVMGEDGDHPYILYSDKIPTQITDEIKNEVMQDIISISGDVTISKKITRCKNLVFNPKSRFILSIPQELESSDFVCIAAKRLVINFPNIIDDMPILNISPPINKNELNGSNGPDGGMGSISGRDDGTNGGDGHQGISGEKGKTYQYPAIYVFYDQIVINIANPSIISGLQILCCGIDGGNGGQGGNGGKGGYGARGEPGDRDCVLGICTCSSGPGRGGNGGNGGSGGKGGRAGKGGNGGVIAFVGPSTEFNKIDKIQFKLTGGKPGLPGEGGKPGDGGSEGGGGSKPFECINGGGSGIPGKKASPPTLGIGDNNVSGLDGTILTSSRDNADLFN